MSTQPKKDSFSEKDFVEEVMRFRELFGSRLFWAKPADIRQKAVDGLAFMYLNLDGSITGEALARVVRLFDSNLTEYTRREILAITHGMAGKE